MQTLDSKLNYSNIISANTTLTDRTSSVINSTSGSNFTSEARSNIEFLIPPISYLDQSASYLRFNVKISANTLPTGPVTGGHVLLDGGACGLFQTATLYNAENQIVSDIQDLPSHMLHYIRSKGLEYANTVGKNVLGYQPQVFENAGYYAVGANDTLYNFVQEELTVEDDSFWPFPARLTYGAGATTPSTTNGSDLTAQLCIPIEMLSPLFSSHKYIPLKHCGTRAHAFRLVLTMADARNALVVTGATAIDASRIAAGIPKYSLTNLEVVVEYVNVSQAVDDVIRAAVASPQGLHLIYEDWTTKVDNGWNSANSSYSIMTPKYTMSMRDVIVQLKPTNNQNDFRMPSVTGSYKCGVTSFQCKVGPQFYPNAPLRLISADAQDSGFNGSAYLELSKTAASVNNKNHQGFFNAARTRSGFELGLSFSRKEDSCHDESNDQFMTGIDSRSGSSNVQFLFERNTGVSLGGSSITVVQLFHSDNVLVLQGGTAYPLERS